MEWVEHERKGNARRGRDAERLERRGCLGRAQGARCEDARTVVVVAHRCSDVFVGLLTEAQDTDVSRKKQGREVRKSNSPLTGELRTTPNGSETAFS
jgi:hypothetical protein